MPSATCCMELCDPRLREEGVLGTRPSGQSAGFLSECSPWGGRPKDLTSGSAFTPESGEAEPATSSRGLGRSISGSRCGSFSPEWRTTSTWSTAMQRNLGYTKGPGRFLLGISTPPFLRLIGFEIQMTRWCSPTPSPQMRLPAGGFLPPLVSVPPIQSHPITGQAPRPASHPFSRLCKSERPTRADGLLYRL